MHSRTRRGGWERGSRFQIQNASLPGRFNPRLQRGCDRVRKFGGADWRRAARDIRRARTRIEYRINGALNGLRFGLQPKAVAQQHRRAQNRANRIGLALPGNIGRAAVDRCSVGSQSGIS